MERKVQVRNGAFDLSGAVSSATYDAANELLNWNGIALTYDANGNMLSDGANAFTWDARNQLASLNGRNLRYDANGRRIQNLIGTSFLYDGGNISQELSGSSVTANLLSGGIDEVFTRTDSSGAFTQLKDALGSTIALVDSNGNVQTAYTYDPFGNLRLRHSQWQRVPIHRARERGQRTVLLSGAVLQSSATPVHRRGSAGT
jgi:YD repeat-containing protein